MKTADKELLYATEVRIDQHGLVDVEYYRRKALQMRAESTAEMVEFVAEKVKAFFAQLALKLFGPRTVPMH